MLLTPPLPVDDDDDKISFDVSVEKTSVPKDSTESLTETNIVNIICDDQFYKILREQVDQSGTKVFGVDLLKLTKRLDNTIGIPNVILVTTQWIKTRCADVEGIFRKSGSLAQVEELKTRLDSGSLMLGDEEDEHVVAHIIKLFFRELPMPLIPYSHYPHFMDIAIKYAEQQIQESEVIGVLTPHLINLAKPHFRLLLYLLKFLSDMSAHAALTKMDSSNLALVFATNIMKAEEETMETSLKFNHVNNLLKLMIEKSDELSNLLPKDEEEISDNWLQDLLKYAKITPVYVEEKEPEVTAVQKLPAETPPSAPPATRASRTNSESADSKRKKDRSGKSSIWSSKEKKKNQKK